MGRIEKCVCVCYVLINVILCFIFQIMPDYYLFHHHHVSKRSIYPSSHIHKPLSEEPQVSYSYSLQQSLSLFVCVCVRAGELKGTVRKVQILNTVFEHVETVLVICFGRKASN